jgi:hypothetical protein
MPQGESITEYFRQALEDIKRDILSRSDEYLLGVNVEEYGDYLLNRYQLPKIEKDPKRDLTVSKERAWQDVDNLGMQISVEVVVARVEYPVIHHRLIEQVLFRTSSTWRPGSPRFDYLDGAIIMRTSPEHLEYDIRQLEEMLGWKNTDVEAGNRRLKESADKIIKDRIDKIRQDKDVFEKAVQKVSIPLKIKKTGQMPVLDLSVKKELKVFMAPKAEKAKEFVLEKGHVLSILEMIGRIGLQFEVAPKVFSKLEEEELRDIILSNLNTVFGGSATGETFSKLGKTDIHLNISEGNILIAECKHWEGERAYHEATDQLFRYLTWRQNYGILITFSRRQGFTNILETAKTCLRAHKTYKGGFSEHSVTHFESHHLFPEDPNKTVEIHHLFFNLYVPKE